MFGLTVEKLFLVALVAAVIIGPRRLPDYAARAAVMLRRATAFAVDARHRVEDETGVAGIREDWRSLDPRRYDPRRIIREAWADAEAGAAATPSGDAAPALSEGSIAEASDPAPEAPAVPDSAATQPGGRWVVTGSSAHPRRVWTAAEG